MISNRKNSGALIGNRRLLFYRDSFGASNLGVFPRANWKGYLRLSLVSCPIASYPTFCKQTSVAL
jgi:hypothetical protein